MVAKKTLEHFPDKNALLKTVKSLAMLDAIMSPDWEYRYSSFNSKWSDGAMLASMRNGGGDEYFVYFNKDGVIIKGFDHESEMSPFADNSMKPRKGVLDEVPKEFEDFLQEPAFEVEFTTFCLWRLNDDSEWRTGNIEYPENDTDADGSNWLLFLLDGKAETYSDWAADYYEQEIDDQTVKEIYEHKPLTEVMVGKLNSERNFADLQKDIEEIGYLVG